MSSTCNIAGCKNDNRSKLKHRQIVMPHVPKLQFHRPNVDDFSRWQTKFNESRTGYEVSLKTRVCSNHFRSGSYTKGEVPCLFLRGYPDWASNRQDLRRKLAGLDDGIIREVAAHVMQYLPQNSSILRNAYLHIGGTNIVEPTLPMDMTAQLQAASPSSVCDMLCSFFNDLPVNKIQEAIAMYKCGILFDSITKVNLKSTSSDRTQLELENHRCLSEHNDEMDFAPYDLLQWHSYSNMPNVSVNMQDCVNNDIPQCDGNVTKSAKNSFRKCKSKKCENEKKILRKKLKNMRAQIVKLSEENTHLKEKKSKMKCELKTVETKLKNVENNVPKRGVIKVNDIKASDDAMKLHTGLPSVSHFDWLLTQIEPRAQKLQYWRGESAEKNYIVEDRAKPGPDREMSIEEELLVTLMTLRLNLLEDHLAFLFGVSVSVISQIVSTWIPFLDRELSPLIHWPDAEDLPACYPTCFERWDNVVSIIDCFEIPAEKPSHVEANAQIFSTYKNRTTVKFLLSCTPGGSISFISPAAGGNMSDVELVRQTDFISKFKPGDACMADKGFRMEGDFIQHGVRLIIPPFVKKGKQFTERNNKKNKLIAHARIHVERVIGRLRDYQILNSVVPVTRLDLIGPATKVCCCLTNLKESVVRAYH